MTEEHEIPLILDEIQAGFCRTGTMFAFEEAGIQPDIITMSKAVGGGMPMAVVVYHKKLDKWGPGAHAGTFRGNQIALALGSETIKYMKEHKLADHAKAMGEKLRSALLALQKEHKCVGDIRGRGLMQGVEIVDPKGKPDHIGSLPFASKLASAIQQRCFHHEKLIIETGGRFSCTLRFLPALVITAEELDEVIKRFSNALKFCEAEHMK